MERVTTQLERHHGDGASRLRVLFGPDAGLEVALPDAGVVIGADPGCDVILRDAAVSGRHLSVKPGPHGFEVADLGSRNGTFLESVAVTRATVPVGAVLRVGRTLVQVTPRETLVEIPPSAAHSFGGMVGRSLAMRRIYGVLERAARSAAPVLFLGESGTGKELAARAVHDASPRAAGPFVVFDCGAASETLIESDLFGHVKGSFTGATQDREGAFAAAHGGTLFLDELGDLPLALQPKLLRLLEAGEVTPLGAQGRKAQKYDVRVVAATHHDLWREVEEGAFRGDLYYRLAVVEVHLPPLRQRQEDLPLLVKQFLERAGVAAGDAELRCANLDRLLGHGWPGNVRELRNVIARAVALSAPGTAFRDMPILLRGGGAPAAAAPAAPDTARSFHDVKEVAIDRVEREYLTELMAHHRDNLSQAARVAGLERKYLYKLLEKHGLLPAK